MAPAKRDGWFFRPTNWDKYHQDKRVKRYNWIKLSTDFFDDPVISRLSDGQKLAWLGVLLVYARCTSHVPFDARWCARRVGLRSAPDLEFFLDQGLIEIFPEKTRSREEERREEKSRNYDDVQPAVAPPAAERKPTAAKKARRPSTPYVPSDPRTESLTAELVTRFNELGGKLRAVATPGLNKLVDAALIHGYTPEQLRDAVAAMSADRWYLDIGGLARGLSYKEMPRVGGGSTKNHLDSLIGRAAPVPAGRVEMPWERAKREAAAKRSEAENKPVLVDVKREALS